MTKLKVIYHDKTVNLGVVFTLGFLFKYNFLALLIFHAPSITGLLLRNLVLLLLIWVVLVPLLNSRRVRLITFLILIGWTVFFISTLWYSRYFGNYLSISDIMMGRGVRPFKVLLLQIGRVYDPVFFVDIFLITIIKKNMQDISAKEIWRSTHYNQKAVRITILAGALLIGQVFTTNLLLGNHSPFVLYNRSTSAFVNVYGILPLYAYELYMLNFTPEKKISAELDSQAPETETDFNGEELVQQDSNIIAIQVESLDERIIGYSHNGTEITPFLNDLKNEALYFDNFYAQHVNGSFDAEFSFLTSIYPINKNYGFKVNDLSRFESIVKILKNRGYSAMAFHGNDKSFFHRHKAFPELGFDKFYSMEDFSMEARHMDVELSTFGINDYDFFFQSVDYIAQAEQPFFAFLITVTSHTPFDFYPQDQAVDAFEDIEDPLVRDYFNSIAFVDSALEMFVGKLEENGLLEDTLLIIYSDHESSVEKPEYSPSDGGFEVFVPNIKAPENIPLFVRHPDIENGTNSTEGTQTDLSPTILDICGEKQRPSEFMGNSLFDQQDLPVLFLHEVPQILFKGQLFAKFPMGIEKIGYKKDIGERDIELPQKEELLGIIDYMQGLILRRRSE